MVKLSTLVYRKIVKPLLFLIQPEKAHHLTLSVFKLCLKLPIINQLLKSSLQPKDGNPHLVLGLNFSNKVGLAAGFDKDGKHMGLTSKMGFGFIEIGTVTPKPQDGNPKPRLFRLPKDEGLINRMGFNNEGLDAFEERLKNNRPQNVIIGANIGKNKFTSNEEAVDDYVLCFNRLHPYADYFVVNVSSPNTPGLRELQNKKPLMHILSTLQNRNNNLDTPKPILLKIAPDITEDQLVDIAKIVEEAHIAGVVATNTTIDRSGLNTSADDIDQIGNGGLSGAPLRKRSTEVVRQLRKLLGPDKTIIGVGGIHDVATAQEKIDAGADLVQIYSGMIYEGPWLVKRIAEGIDG